jgi:hypothetical protein
MAPTTTAAMEGVRYLYHYQRFNADWLWETIGNGVVHCPSPADFNDPWDCRPYFNDAFVDDAERRERFIQYIDRADRRHGPTLSEEFRVARLEELRGDRNRLRSLVQELSRIDSAIHERYRVYCLTSHPDSILMWSHYADRHRGLALEFATDNECFSAALKVAYYSRYPSLEYGDTDPSTILLPLLAKSNSWSHEEEYRLIAEERSIAYSTETLQTRGKSLQIPNTALKSVIVGCLMPTNERDTVRDLIARSGRQIGLKQAVRVRNEYRVSIEPVIIKITI